MKNKLFLLGICLLSSMILEAQKSIFILHDSVGDTITKEEIVKYNLFDKTDISKTSYCLISLIDSTNYTVSFRGEENMKINLSSKDIKQYQLNIETLNQTIYRKKTAELIEINIDTLALPDLDLELMTNEQREQMIQEAYRLHYLIPVANEQGLTGSEREAFISGSGFYLYSKKKKKNGENKSWIRSSLNY